MQFEYSGKWRCCPSWGESISSRIVTRPSAVGIQLAKTTTVWLPRANHIGAIREWRNASAGSKAIPIFFSFLIKYALDWLAFEFKTTSWVYMSVWKWQTPNFDFITTAATTFRPNLHKLFFLSIWTTHFLFCNNFPIQGIIKHTNRLKSGFFQTLL